MRPGSGWVLVLTHLSFASVRVQGPSEQIRIDLRVLSIRSILSTSANIEPVKGEYR
jgi:hypothetical protein